MRTITLKLAAGTRDEITAPGNFLHLVESSAAVDIELDNGMRLQDMLAGTWAEPGEFNRIAFYSDTAQTIKILVARGRAGVFRVSGEVSVISGEVARSKSGVAYFAGRGVSPLAANYSYLQLWNPAGSGKRSVVEEVIVHNGVAVTGSVILRDSTAQILDFVQNGKSKRIGVADSAMQIRSERNAGVLGISALSEIMCAQQTVPLAMREPIVVEPGNGLLLMSGAVNEIIRGQFQWYEEAI